MFFIQAKMGNTCKNLFKTYVWKYKLKLYWLTKYFIVNNEKCNLIIIQQDDPTKQELYLCDSKVELEELSGCV